jgi:RNA polymerase sigma factor (sigma-70 family)
VDENLLLLRPLTAYRRGDTQSRDTVMTQDNLDTLRMNDWIYRGRQGDRSAYDSLLRAAQQRLEHMAQAMMSRYPRVRECVEMDDVLQNAVLRLLRALEVCSLSSTREFYNLAAEQIRRELLDLTRYFRSRPCVYRNELTDSSIDRHASVTFSDATLGSDRDEIERWQALHEAVELLPALEREVFGLVFYHGWTQRQIAELLQVSERQVRRLQAAALLKLSKQLGGELPSEVIL